MDAQLLQPVVLGDTWVVFNRSEHYDAEVVGLLGDRIQIRRICPPGVFATPTLALRSMFTNQDGGYLLAQEIPA